MTFENGIVTLQQGESVDADGGYVSRSYADGASYYAETSEGLSPSFATFAEAYAWLRDRADVECSCGAVIELKFRDTASALHNHECPLYDEQGE